MHADDETNLTEIELLSDGRICVFGTSRPVLEILDDLAAGQDEGVRRRLRAGAPPTDEIERDTH
ncbi:MAG: hypothetical protein IT424_10420 [Pirellulales bacterium]|nr:hypothetical protein [Pirellulales bacterium]